MSRSLRSTLGYLLCTFVLLPHNCPAAFFAASSRANAKVFRPCVLQAANAVVPPVRLNDLVLQLTMQQLWLLVGSIWGAPLAAVLWAHDKLATKEDLREVKEDLREMKEEQAEMKKEQGEMKMEQGEMKKDLREVKKEQGEMKMVLQEISHKLDKVYGDAAVAKGLTMGTGLSALIVAAVWLLHRQR